MLSLHHTTLLSTLLLCLAASVQAVSLRGQVGSNHVLREFFYVGPGAKVIAHSVNATSDGSVPATYEAYIKRDGSFVIDLPDPVGATVAEQSTPVGEEASVVTAAPPQSDVYLLKFHVRALNFDQYRIDVRPSKKAGQAPVVAIRPHSPFYPLSSALYLSDPLPSPFIVTANSVNSYFHSIQDFNALNYLWMTLKSPMILMALGAWAMVSLMPKLMANLDPEEQAMMARNQAQMAERMSALQSGDWKGMVADAQSSPSERIPAAGSSGSGGGGGKKKR